MYDVSQSSIYCTLCYVAQWAVWGVDPDISFLEDIFNSYLVERRTCYRRVNCLMFCDPKSKVKVTTGVKYTQALYIENQF